MNTTSTPEDVRSWLIERGFDVDAIDDQVPDVPAPSTPVNVEKRPTHRWFKLRLHTYICQKCGAGKVNAAEGKTWRTTFHLPDGTSVSNGKTPPCEIGPKTAAYLAHYANEIAKGKPKS